MAVLPGGGHGAAELLAATDKHVFFRTTLSLDPNDDNATGDVYAFDRSANTMKLVTDRQGSRRAAGQVEEIAVSPNGSRLMFRTPAPGPEASTEPGAAS